MIADTRGAFLCSEQQQMNAGASNKTGGRISVLKIQTLLTFHDQCGTIFTGRHEILNKTDQQ